MKVGKGGSTGVSGAATAAETAEDNEVEVADTSLLATLDTIDQANQARIPGLNDGGFTKIIEEEEPFEPERCRHGYWKPSKDLVLGAHEWLKGDTSKEIITDSHDDDFPAEGIRSDKQQAGIDVTIESGAGLATNESNPLGPYVKATVTGGASMTTGNKDTSSSPTWGDCGFLPCAEWQNGVIMFDVYQRDAIQSKIVGCGLLDIASLKLTRDSVKRLDVVLTEKHRVQNRGKNKGLGGEQNFGTLGTIRVKIQYAFRNPRKARLINSAAKKEKVGKLVTVDVVEARYLSAMDSNGKSDPYVVVSIGNSSERTKTVKECLDPEFGERFDFAVNTLSEPLEIKVYDDDILRDDLMGSAVIELSDYEVDTPKASWYTIRLQDGSDQGQVFLNITVSSLWSAPRVITAHDRKQVAGVLTIWVKEAKGLRAADSTRFGTGKSDPFAVVEVGRQRYRTRTIDSTLRPKWGRKFEFLINDVYSPIQVTVNDEDKGQSFDFLGCVVLSLLDLPSGEQWYALKAQNLIDRAQGDILIEAEFSYHQYKAMKGLLLPREVSYIMEKDPKFSTKQLSANISRVKAALADMAAPFVQLALISSGKCTSVVGVIFIIVWYYLCLHSQLWHVPYWVIAGMYFQKWKPKPKKALAADEEGNVFEVQYEDSDGEEPNPKKKKKAAKKKGKGKKGPLAEFKGVKRLAKDQYGQINNAASWLERLKNLFLWHQHAIASAMVLLLLLTSLVIYFFGPFLKYGALLGGYVRFGKGFYRNLTAKKLKKRKKHAVVVRGSSSGNPLLNLLGRVPSDEDIMRGYRRYRPQTKSQKEKRMEKLLSKISLDGVGSP